ncbi:hypothetical protein ESP57_13580 [Agromyces fucosus]|uniref:Uncharacterized protein n=1 Tax=Agromyces fucosus TaxID=41985 RepID=A0A4Q2JIJ0_9MICO|nr:hypothetical protein [Agromyces fucosus]RXZ47572.1 hypothetical protein ESP57_13580 [Agromyces fucosus]
MTEFDDRDIIEGSSPGGANTSGSMLLPTLQSLLSSLPASANFDDYERQAVEFNVLGRDSFEGRKRTFRALREMYLLDRDRILFRALRDLWVENPLAQPLLAGLSVLARDSSFRATSPLILTAKPGDTITNGMMADSLGNAFPGYSRPSTEKIGRNTAASWSQTGHLVGRTNKERVLVTATPVSMSYAMFLGHLQGLRGRPLLDTLWVDFLDVPTGEREALALEGARKGYLEYKSGGNVVEVGFRHLLRPMAGVRT